MPQGPAPDQNALTLFEWQKFANSPLYDAVVMSLYDNGSVFVDIPFKTDQSMLAVGSRFTGKNMPRVDFRKINDLPVGTKAVPERFQETAYIIRNDVVIDKYLATDKNSIVSLKAFETDAYLKSVGYKGNDYFINNRHDGLMDHDDAPVGIDARITDPKGTYGVQAGLAIDAGVNISLAGITAAQANKLLVQIDRTLSAMGSRDGEGVIIYGNEVAMRLVSSAIRNLPGGAGFSTTTDNYDKEVMKYKKAVLKDIGRKDNQVEYIISPYQTAAGVNATGGGVPTVATPATYGQDSPTAGTNFTSLYFVRYGDMYFRGWQWDVLKAQDFGLVTPPGTYHMILFDWAFGYYMSNSRSLAKLYDIQVGAT